MRRLMAYIALAFCLLVVAPAWGAEPSSLTVDAIIAGLAKAEAAVHDLTVDITDTKVNQFVASANDTATKKQQAQPQHLVCHSIVDAQGRVREEGFGEMLRIRGPELGNYLYTQYWLNVFDGAESRSFTMSRLFETPRVSISNTANQTVLSPWEVTTRYANEPVSKWLREGGAELLPPEQWEGRPVVVIEQKPLEKNGQWKMRFWIDIERNFAVVRRASLRKSTNDPDWVTYTHIDGMDFTSVTIDVWAPKRALYESYNTWEGKITGVAWSDELIFSQWKVNQKPPAKLFEQPIPEGAQVSEQR